MRHRQAQVISTKETPKLAPHLLQGNAGMGLIHLHSELRPDALHLGSRKEQSQGGESGKMADIRTLSASALLSGPAEWISSAHRQRRSPASPSSGT